MNTRIRNSSVMTIAVAAVITLATVSAHAAITIDNTTVGTAAGGATGTWTIPGIDASASDKMVMVIGARRNFGSGLTAINSVKYNGVDMTQAVLQVNPATDILSSVYYLDNPGAGGDVVVSFNNGTWTPDSGYSILELSGTAAGVEATSGSDGNFTGPFAVGGGSEASLVVAGSENFINAPGSPAPQAPLIDLGATGGLGSGYQFVLGGNVTPTFDDNGATTVAASFAAAAAPASGTAPEPSTLVLAAFGLVGLVGTRRRRRR